MMARHNASLDHDNVTLRSRFRSLLNSAKFEFELYLLCGVLVGLCLCFVLIERDEEDLHGLMQPLSQQAGILSTRRLPDHHVPAETGSTAIATGSISRFAFVPDPSAGVRLASIDLSSTLRPAAAEAHFLLASHRGVDPLGAALVSGLPTGSTFSHGLRFGDRHWALGFGTLDKLVIDLPPEHSETVRAVVDLRSREGVVMHSFEVELRTGQKPIEPAMVSEVQPPKSKRPTKQGRQRPLVLPAVAKPAAAGKSNAAGLTGVAKVWPGDPAGIGGPQQPNLVPGPLFKPDPKDTSASGLRPAERDDPRSIIMRGLERPAI